VLDGIALTGTAFIGTALVGASLVGTTLIDTALIRKRGGRSLRDALPRRSAVAPLALPGRRTVVPGLERRVEPGIKPAPITASVGHRRPFRSCGEFTRASSVLRERAKD